MYILSFFIFWSKLSIKLSNSLLIKNLSEFCLIKACLVYFGFILTFQAKPDSLKAISATHRSINPVHYLFTYNFRVITSESHLEHFGALGNSTVSKWALRKVALGTSQFLGIIQVIITIVGEYSGT